MTISATQQQPVPGVPDRPAPPTPGAHWTHLGHALQGLLGLYLAVCVAQVALFTWQASTLAGWADRPVTSSVETAEAMDRWGVVAGASDLLFVALIGPLFITWLYQAHHSDRMYRPALRHRSGWAIGGWFVPILNFWRPMQMVNDVRRGALGHEPLRGGALVGWWWGLMLLGGVLAQVTGGLLPDGTENPRQTFAALQDVAVALGLTTTLTGVSCVLAIAVVRHVTALVRAPRT